MTKFKYKGRRFLVDGAEVTATAAELNANAGVTAGAVTAGKVLVADANKDLATLRHLTISGNLVTGSTTLSEAELGVLDAVTAATAAASKAAVLGAAKELNGALVRQVRNAPVAGAGSVIGDAAPLLEGFQVITGANGTVGWILPVAVAGMVVIIKGTTAGVAKIWPQSGAQINAVGASTAFSLASGVIPAIFIADSATQWYSIPLVPS